MGNIMTIEERIVERFLEKLKSDQSVPGEVVDWLRNSGDILLISTPANSGWLSRKARKNQYYVPGIPPGFPHFRMSQSLSCETDRRKRQCQGPPRPAGGHPTERHFAV